MIDEVANHKKRVIQEDLPGNQEVILGDEEVNRQEEGVIQEVMLLLLEIIEEEVGEDHQ